MPFFSVIIPAYNRADMIPAALDSVLAQEFTDWEAIIVDDGSTDQTLAVIEGYAARHAGRIIVLQQPNSGPGAARNRAVQRASGQYMVFLDSDDLWFPWTLATYRQAIEQYQNPAFLAGMQLDFHANADLGDITKASFRADAFADYYTAARAALPWILPGAVAIRSDALKAAGGFANQRINAEDSDLWLKLGCAAGFVRIHSPFAFGYRRHDGSAIADVERTYLGTVHMIDQECNGRYPGGADREFQRRKIICEHLRPVSVTCLRQGRIGWGFLLYRRTLLWHLRVRRFKYLVGFPMLAIGEMSRQRAAHFPVRH